MNPDSTISRRRALQVGALALAGLAGCGGRDTDSAGETPTTQTEGDAPSPTPDGTATPDPDRPRVLDIRDFGARVDGTTDDTAAVRRAIEAASAGDIVLFPAGETLVSVPENDVGTAKGGRAAVYLDDANAGGLTLSGEGRRSVVKMAGGHRPDMNNFVFHVNCKSGVDGLRIQQLTVDGNAANNPDRTTTGVLCWPDGGVNDVRLEGLWVENCSETGIQLQGAGTRADWCTARNNGLHGFSVDNGSDAQEPVSVVKNALAVGNGGLGLRQSDGRGVFDRFYCEDNGQGGMKFSRYTREVTVTNGTFANNGTMGFRYNSEVTDEPIRCRLDNVVAVDNPWAGFWLAGNVEYSVGEILSGNNNATSRQGGNIDVVQRASVDADRVHSYDAAAGFGIYYGSENDSRVRNYLHAGNEAGPSGGPSSAKLALSDRRSFGASDGNGSATPATNTARPSLPVPDEGDVGAENAPIPDFLVER